jgi:hypothetical protein
MSEEKALKKLKVDLDELSLVMDTDRYENEAYLDTETGDIVYVPIELNEDNVYDDEYVSGLLEWEKETAEDAKLVYEDEDDRYILIPERTSHDGYDIMVRFAKRLDDSNVSEKLFDALDGRGAFRRFNSVLRKYPKIEKKWFQYKEEMEKQEVKEWLGNIGIDPVEE